MAIARHARAARRARQSRGQTAPGRGALGVRARSTDQRNTGPAPSSSGGPHESVAQHRTGELRREIEHRAERERRIFTVRSEHGQREETDAGRRADEVSEERRPEAPVAARCVPPERHRESGPAGAMPRSRRRRYEARTRDRRGRRCSSSCPPARTPHRPPPRARARRAPPRPRPPATVRRARAPLRPPEPARRRRARARRARARAPAPPRAA